MKHILLQDILVKMTRKLPIRTDIQVALFSEETETKYTGVFIGVCYPMWQFYWLGVLITLDIWDIWNVLFLYSQKKSKGNMVGSQDLTKLYAGQHSDSLCDSPHFSTIQKYFIISKVP